MNRQDRLRIADRIDTLESRAGRWHVLSTPVQGVVSVKGSIETSPDFESGEDLIQNLTVAMMDKGTLDRSKRALAEFLEDRGASTNFSSAGTRIRFSARCLSPDLVDILHLLFEQLASPAFDEQEFLRVRTRVASNAARQLTHTGTRAGRILSRRLYPPGHPNRSPEVESEIERLSEIGRKQLLDYHASNVRANNLRLAIVGDVPEELPVYSIPSIEHGWSERPRLEADSIEPPEPAGQENMDISDRPNLDVRMGHRVDVKRLDDDFLALYVGIFALGGNFSSRLMSVVRDQLGLTYGIRSGLTGVDRYHTGHWEVSVTLSADRLQEGIRASREVIQNYLQDGITQDELDAVKTTLVGSYEVRLETTSAIASTILSHLERGYGIERLDTLPDEIEALTMDQVNSALSRHLSLDKLHVCTAGTRIVPA